MPDLAATDIDRELQQLDTGLKRLEAEYTMFFAGRLPIPPWELRARIAGLVTHIDRQPLPNYGDRFRFTTLQARFATFVDLWDRALRAREEGRPGPFGGTRSATPDAPLTARDRILHVATFTDPLRELDKVRDLYHSVGEARAEAGAEPVPFHRFVQLVREQVTAMQRAGSAEVAFRLSMQGGKLSFTARGLTGTAS